MDFIEEILHSIYIKGFFANLFDRLLFIIQVIKLLRG